MEMVRGKWKAVLRDGGEEYGGQTWNTEKYCRLTAVNPHEGGTQSEDEGYHRAGASLEEGQSSLVECPQKSRVVLGDN